MDADAQERKLATVVFADLVGSTDLGSELDPERLRALLGRFYDAMAAEITAAGGTVEKFAGDAVMAAFGAPAALEDHAERALHAALSMRRRLGELFGGSLALRIGVNTAEVVVGRPREGSSFVTGDAVNVAARLEQAAGPGQILAGERTVAAARGAFEFDEPIVVEAKGKPEGVRARRLVRALSLMRPRGVSGLEQAFVGRTVELDELRSSYRRAVEQSRPVLATIIGDAGVGKTRLVREFWGKLAEEVPEPIRRTGRCLSYGEGITYWPLGEVLREHFGIVENDSPLQVRRRLGDREILGLALGLDVAGSLHPLAARDRLHEAWISFLEDLAAERPVVVLLEDLHWAEPPLLELVERLTRDVSGPLLVLATARPELLELRAGWGSGRIDSTVLRVEPLPAESTAELVEALVGVPLPGEILDLVVERAEGNPFFVEEVLESLIDSGVLERSKGNWTVHQVPTGLDTPDSVHAVIAARIDLLPAKDKAALQAASVIGRTFWTTPVYELLGGLEPDFRLLEERDFIRRRIGSSLLGEREYVFKHALTGQVAYESLPKPRRARLHAAFAQWLERLGEGRDEHVVLLAYHYAEAVRPEDADLVWAGADEELKRLQEKAIAWLQRAAELAVGRYEIDDALTLLHRALALGVEGIRAIELWKRIARANALRFDGGGFSAAIERWLELSPDRATRAEAYGLLAFAATTRPMMWGVRPSPEQVDAWIERLLDLADPGSPDQVRGLVAKAIWHVEDEASAVKATETAEALNDVELISFAWNARAQVAAAAGRYEEALSWEQRRLGIIQEIDDPDHRSLVYMDAVWASVALGRFAEARRLAAENERCVAPLTAHHHLHGTARVLFVEKMAEDWEAIRRLQDRAERAVSENRTTCGWNPLSLLICALGQAQVGEAAEASRLEGQALALDIQGLAYAIVPYRMWLALTRSDLEALDELLASTPPNPADLRLAELPLARLDALVALGRWEAIAEEAPALLIPGSYMEPFALRALGMTSRERPLIERALDRFEGMGLARHADEMRALLLD